MEPANESSNMTWDVPSTSFLHALPVQEENGGQEKREMFPKEMPKNRTAEQARQAALAQIENDSNRALAELKAGVRVGHFVPTLKKVASFKMNEKDPEVSLFLEKLNAICVKVSKAEARVLLLEEHVSLFKLYNNLP
jgi:hypothetical protein